MPFVRVYNYAFVVAGSVKRNEVPWSFYSQSSDMLCKKKAQVSKGLPAGFKVVIIQMVYLTLTTTYFVF